MEWIVLLMALVVLGLIGLIIALFFKFGRVAPSAQNQQDRAFADLKIFLEQGLGNQRSDFRDVARTQFESVHKSVQDALVRQSTTLEQRFNQLQHQNDVRLQEIRAQMEKQLKENLEQNSGAFKEMTQGLGELKSSAGQMLKIGEQVSELNHILASPKLQGNFGEAALEQLLADILPAGGFEWQPRLAEGCQPDATIRVKNMRLCVDAKFPKDRMAALLDAAKDESALEQARKELGRVIKDMAGEISKKYVRPELGTTDQAFLFVPSESLYYEILKLTDVTEFCRKQKVTIVSPNTLSATLYAVALAFRGYEMQENARAMMKTVEDMHRHFGNFQKDFVNMGKRLRQTQEDYERATHDLNRFDRTLGQLRDGQARLEDSNTDNEELSS